MKKNLLHSLLLFVVFYSLSGCGREFLPNAPLSASATPVPTCATIVYIPDANLRAAILSAAGKGNCASCAICGSDLTKVTELYLSNNNVSDYMGLTLCTSVSNLYMNGVKSTAAIPLLAGMPSITSLTISNAGLAGSDLTGLSVLTNLQFLDLGNNNINDLTQLSGLVKLQTLNVDGNVLFNLNGIQTLVNLQTLEAATNNINDISATGMLVNLRYIYLSSNNITSITALASDTSLRTLIMSSNNISSLSPLSGLLSLSDVDLSYNQIADISALTMNAAAGGLGGGDTVNLHGNSLNATPDADTYINYLKGRDVNITYP